ncbi:TPA: replication initiator protein A [Streptococcus suis]
METAIFFKNEVEKFQYYQFPKWLMKEPYCELSLLAKMVYTLLYDRLGLSIKNEWYDEDGKVYIHYSNENLARKDGGVNCSIPTVIKAKKELANAGLLTEVRQGLTLSNRIYLKGPNILNQEVKNFKYRTKNSLILDDKNLKTNKTEYIKTEYSNDNNDMAQIISSFQKAFRGHTPTPFQFEELQKYLNDDGMNVDIIIEAIIRTSNNNANFSYLQGILRNWARKGIKTVEQVLADDASHQQKKSGWKRSNPVPHETNIPSWALEEIEQDNSEEAMQRMQALKAKMLADEKGEPVPDWAEKVLASKQTAEGQAKLADVFAELEAMENETSHTETRS